MRILVWFMSILLGPAVVNACTTFCLSANGEFIFAKNYDWGIDYGLVVVNKRNVAKSSSLNRDSRPANWVSRYGSVTFNQCGREFPSGGINEKGLVVELMWLNDAVYPADQALPAVGTLEWIQYQLDNYAGVNEVIASASKIRIASPVKLHYLVADRTGNAASIEFLGGQFVPHNDKTMPVKVLTNDTYDRSVQFLRQHTGFGGNLQIPAGSGSLERFVRASAAIQHYRNGEGSNIVDYAFQTLADVAQPGYTQWSIVYDPSNLKISFRTRGNQAIRSIQIQAMDFSCATASQVFDLSQKASGDVTRRFIPYTFEINRDLLRKSYRGTSFLAETPDSEINSDARHPDAFRCL